MKHKWILALGFSLEVIAGTGCTSQTAEADMAATPPVATSAKAASVTVVLVADLGEADDSCGCGGIIRSVRAAAANGLRVREVDARNKEALQAATQKYRVLVQPSVVLVDEAERELRRFEGESKDTVRALDAELAQLAKK